MNMRKPRTLGLIEYAYYQMALIADIEMMPCWIQEDGNLHHFVTERFDRIDNRRLHVQSYAAMAHVDRDPPGAASYEGLFNTMVKLGLPSSRLAQMYLRMLFNIVTRNQDDHTKNHAFIMDEDGHWDLSPAYDLCFSYKPTSQYIREHQMNCMGQRDNFTWELLANFAKNYGIRNPKKYLRAVTDAAHAFLPIARDLGIPSQQANAIFNTFRLL